MTGNKHAARANQFLLVTVILLAGCRSISLPGPPIEEVSAERKQREAAAIEEFERKRAYAEFQAAQAAWNRGDLPGSQANLERLLRRTPRHRDGRLLLGKVHLEQGHRREALAQLETALADFPDDPKVHHVMGVLLEKLNRPKDAWAHSDRATKLAAEQNQPPAGGPDHVASDPSAHRATMQSTGSVVPTAGVEPARDRPISSQQGSGRTTRAVGAEDRDGANDGGRTSVAELLRRVETCLADGALERALVHFRQAAALDPDNPQIPTTAAIAALRRRSPQVAMVMAQEALVAFPNWTPLLRTLGTAYYRQGDYESSQLVLQQALSLDKSDALAYFLLGCTYTKLGQSEAAEACFAEARRISPSLAAGHMSGVHDSLR